MLDITTITRQNVTSVVGYYSDAKDDYYSKDSSFTSCREPELKPSAYPGTLNQPV
ncbi:hypothetical protein [Raoultella planticola]|uniref:Uncharacterized protein n=1 Tax=Raoultella planticola TaxID=575 RepID=A0A9Q9P1Y2_RAOPL|nr:hypothetical protein [Raoultella planticola]UYA92901.1 hypothetical protein KKU17_p00025 [Raoultella planticola]